MLRVDSSDLRVISEKSTVQPLGLQNTLCLKFIIYQTAGILAP